MRYVKPADKHRAARDAMVNFSGVGNIHVSGSVKGMQRHYGWQRAGQVRVGSYIYNVGVAAVERLSAKGYLKGVR